MTLSVVSVAVEAPEIVPVPALFLVTLPGAVMAG